MAMTPRENMMAVLNWEKPEYIPLALEGYHICRLPTGVIDQPWTGGTDSFGLKWVATPEGAMPEPGQHVFDDITEWRDYFHFPNLDDYDFDEMAAKELAGVDRNEKVVDVLSVCGLFERLLDTMGFEDALCALVMEPEACRDFFSELADFKIEYLSRVIESYKPDMITYFDDLATSRGPFISLKTYREVIKPYHKKIVESVTSKGVIFAQHCCGKCQSLLEDFVELGVTVWSSAQISNDISEIKRDFHGRLVVEGGWDTTGPCSMMDGTVEEAVEEAKRCAREYGPDYGFIMQITLMNKNGNSLRVGDPRLDEVKRIWRDIATY